MKMQTWNLQRLKELDDICIFMFLYQEFINHNISFFIALKTNYIKNKRERDYRVCSPLLFEDVADLLDMPEL